MINKICLSVRAYKVLQVVESKIINILNKKDSYKKNHKIEQRIKNKKAIVRIIQPEI